MDEQQDTRPGESSLPATEEFYRSMQGVVTPPDEETTALLDIEQGRLGGNYGSQEASEAGSSKSVTIDPAMIDNNKMAKRIKYYIPSTDWIPKYSLSLLFGDILAGATVASMLIPQSVSYASSLAKLSPVTGLFSAAIPGIVYALLGTTRQLNVAPEAALSLLLGQAVTDFRYELPDPHSGDADALGLAVASVITVQVGLITFLLGIFRLGFIDVVLSRPLLRGFISAIAVVILVEQLIPMFGLVALEHTVHPDGTLSKMEFLIRNVLTHYHSPTTIISFGALTILVSLRYFKSMFPKYWWIYRMPEVLLVVVVSILLSDEFKWDQKGIDILGSISINTGKSFLQFPIRHSTIKYLRRTTSTAGIISVVGFLDSIAAAKQNSARYGYSISPNRELVALGAGNIVQSFIPGALPAYGSITRSRINGDVGARTQMASIVCSVIVLFTTFFLLPSMYYLPKCVLASIICLVVISLLSEAPHDIKYYWEMRSWVDLALMSMTFFFSIIWDVEVGIVVSVITSLLLVVHRSSRARMTILGHIPGTNRWKPIKENPEALEDIAGALIVRLRENLDFANTAQLKERLRRLELYGERPTHPSEEPSRQQASFIVFHMDDVDTCDACAIQIFYELLKMYQNRGVRLFVTHLRPGPRAMFAKAGIMELLGEDAFCDSVADAIARLGTAG